MRDLTIAVVGSAFADITIRTPRLPHSGENLYVDELISTAGGKGSNAAITLARHGARVHLITNVGADPAGEQVRAALAAEGIGLSGLGCDPEIATGTVSCLRSQRRRVIWPTPAPAARFRCCRRGTAGSPCPARRCLPESGSAGRGAAAVARLSRQHGVLLTWTPPDLMPLALWSHAAPLSPNLSEAVHAGMAIATPRGRAACIMAQGPALVVVKLGNRGAARADGERAICLYRARRRSAPARATFSFAGLAWALFRTGHLTRCVGPSPAARWSSADWHGAGDALTRGGQRLSGRFWKGGSSGRSSEAICRHGR